MFQTGDLVKLKSDVDMLWWVTTPEMIKFLCSSPFRIRKMMTPTLIQFELNSAKNFVLGIEHFEPWTKYKAGDLVRINGFKKHNEVFKIIEVHQKNATYTLSSRLTYCEEELKPATNIQVGDHVFVQKCTLGSLAGEDLDSEIPAPSSEKICQVSQIFSKCNNASGIGISVCNDSTIYCSSLLNLVDSETPLSSPIKKTKFKVGELVRLHTPYMESPQRKIHTVQKIEKNPTGKYIYSFPAYTDGDFIEEWLEPVIDIQAGDRVKIIQLNNFNNLFCSKIGDIEKVAKIKTEDGNTFVYLTNRNCYRLSELEAVDSQTSLTISYNKLGKEVVDSPTPVNIELKPAQDSMKDEIAYLRNLESLEKERLQIKINQLAAEKITSAVELQKKLHQIDTLTKDLGMEGNLNHELRIKQQDLQGQLMLSQVEVEKLKKNKIPDISFRQFIGNKILAMVTPSNSQRFTPSFSYHFPLTCFLIILVIALFTGIGYFNMVDIFLPSTMINSIK